jgi:hypothetical protein
VAAPRSIISDGAHKFTRPLYFRGLAALSRSFCGQKQPYAIRVGERAVHPIKNFDEAPFARKSGTFERNGKNGVKVSQEICGI